MTPAPYLGGEDVPFASGHSWLKSLLQGSRVEHGGGWHGWESWTGTQLGKAECPEMKRRHLKSPSAVGDFGGGCWLFFMRLLETPQLWETLKYLHFWQDRKVVSYPE